MKIRGFARHLKNSKQERVVQDRSLTVVGLLKARTPSLTLGLLLGMMLSLTTSQFKEVLESYVQVAFFLPFVVYMADAVGTQTQQIYIRDLTSGRASFSMYLRKELLLGVFLGLFTGVFSFFLSYLWIGYFQLSVALGLAMFSAVSIAPIIALLTAQVLQMQHTDPALGTGPLATVIQDALSIAIFGTITGLLL